MSRHPWHATNHCNTTFLEFMQREWSPGKLAGEACAGDAYAILCLPAPCNFAPSGLMMEAAAASLQAVAFMYFLNVRALRQQAWCMQTIKRTAAQRSHTHSMAIHHTM